MLQAVKGEKDKSAHDVYKLFLFENTFFNTVTQRPYKLLNAVIDLAGARADYVKQCEMVGWEKFAGIPKPNRKFHITLTGYTDTTMQLSSVRFFQNKPSQELFRPKDIDNEFIQINGIELLVRDLSPLAKGWLSDVMAYNHNTINGYVFRVENNPDETTIQTDVSWKMVKGDKMFVGQCPYKQYICQPNY
jgi:hypothetical protein